jgi:hypothetical protein
MKVERALLVTSPAYDLGTTEAELRATYRRYFEDLWNAGGSQPATPE